MPEELRSGSLRAFFTLRFNRRNNADDQESSQSFIDYLTVTLEGTVPDRYADPYGSGRIRIIGQ